MRFTALIELLYHRLALANPVRPARRQQRSFVPGLDVLEDRTLLSAVSFGPPLFYPASVGETGGNAVAVGDFNNDGKLDLAVTSPLSTLGVLLGNGDGTFRTAPSPGQFPSSSLVVGDFNGDGKLDLVTANTYNNSVSVLLGNGDGTFQTARNFAAGAQGFPVAVGDFDGRHYANGLPILDLVTANFYSNTVSVLLGNGDGTFQTARNFAVASGPSFVAIGDLNGDGKADLVVSQFGDFYGNNAGVSVLLGNGDGTFQPAQVFAAGIPSLAVVVADFNGDGKPDLALANGYGGGVHVLLGNGDGTFGVAQEVEPLPFRSVDQLAVGDFNGDGKPDLVTASDWTRVLLGNGDGTFGVAQAVGPQDDIEGQVTVGDFNGDGKPDLAHTGYVLLNQFVTTTALSGPTSSTYGQPVTYTATVTSDAPVRAGTVTFFDTGTPVSPALPLDDNGQATFSFTSLSPGSHTITASYSGAAGGAGFTGFDVSAASTGLTVNPAPLSASAVNFDATAGAPFSGAVAPSSMPTRRAAPRPTPPPSTGAMAVSRPAPSPARERSRSAASIPTPTRTATLSAYRSATTSANTLRWFIPPPPLLTSGRTCRTD
jgi:hypothetical protein